jgi:hypothetical protein
LPLVFVSFTPLPPVICPLPLCPLILWAYFSILYLSSLYTLSVTNYFLFYNHLFIFFEFLISYKLFIILIINLSVLCLVPCFGSAWALCHWFLLLGRRGVAFNERCLSLLILFIIFYQNNKLNEGHFILYVRYRYSLKRQRQMICNGVYFTNHNSDCVSVLITYCL